MIQMARDDMPQAANSYFSHIFIMPLVVAQIRPEMPRRQQTQQMADMLGHRAVRRTEDILTDLLAQLRHDALVCQI